MHRPRAVFLTRIPPLLEALRPAAIEDYCPRNLQIVARESAGNTLCYIAALTLVHEKCKGNVTCSLLHVKT